MKPKLSFLIGCPRSGKSSYAKNWLHYPTIDRLQAKALVCADDIRLELGHMYHQPLEDFVQTTKWLMVKTLLRSGHNVLIDGTHSTENSLRKIFEIDKDAEAIWYPSYHIYRDEVRCMEFEKVCTERGLRTKGHKIVEPLRRIIWQCHKLANKTDAFLRDMRDAHAKPN